MNLSKKNNPAPQFLAKTGTKSLEVKEKGLDKACGDLLRKLCEKCVPRVYYIALHAALDCLCAGHTHTPITHTHLHVRASAGTTTCWRWTSWRR